MYMQISPHEDGFYLFGGVWDITMGPFFVYFLVDPFDKNHSIFIQADDKTYHCMSYLLF